MEQNDNKRHYCLKINPIRSLLALELACSMKHLISDMIETVKLEKIQVIKHNDADSIRLKNKTRKMT